MNRIRIALVTLIAGGVVVANIMLISVNERRKEIGLRMAVGASRKNIMTQFVLEASILGVGGGLCRNRSRNLRIVHRAHRNLVGREHLTRLRRACIRFFIARRPALRCLSGLESLTPGSYRSIEK